VCGYQLQEPAIIEAPHNLPPWLKILIPPDPPPTYEDKINGIMLEWWVEHLRIKREFQDDFYDLAKGIGSIRWHDVITGKRYADATVQD
jgi:hypothetical protein